MSKIPKLLEEAARIEKEIFAIEASQKIQQINEYLSKLEEAIEESQAKDEEIEALQKEFDALKFEHDEVTRQLEEEAVNRERTKKEIRQLKQTIDMEKAKAEMAESDEHAYREEIQIIEDKIREEEGPPNDLDVRLTILENLGVTAICNKQNTCVDNITMCSHDNQEIRTIPYDAKCPALRTRHVWNFISPPTENNVLQRQ